MACSRAYYQCLLLTDTIFEKFGDIPIMHHYPEGYYLALVRLRHPAKLEAFHKLMAEGGRPDNNKFRALYSQTAHAPAPPVAIADDVAADHGHDDEEDEEEEGAGDDDLDAVVAAVLDGLPSDASSVSETISFDGPDYNELVTGAPGEARRYTISFDNCSHSHGRQRAYTRCQSSGDGKHTNCFKYVICDLFEDRQSLLAWMAAWVALGMQPGQEKEDHKKCMGEPRHKRNPEMVAHMQAYVPE